MGIFRASDLESGGFIVREGNSGGVTVATFDRWHQLVECPAPVKKSNTCKINFGLNYRRGAKAN